MVLKAQYTVIFFAENSGNEPVKEWIKELDLDEQKKIGKYLEVLQERWPIVRAPLVKPLSKDIFELRVRLRNRIARILFVSQDMYIILVHGFIKKTQKTPSNEIEVASKRVRRHREEKQYNDKKNSRKNR